MLISGGGWPILAPFGRIIYRWGQIGMPAISPNGSVDWISTHPNNPNYPNRPTGGSDGAIYASDSLGLELLWLNADGSTGWAQPTNYNHNASTMSISPNDSMLIVGGAGDNGGPDFRGWIRGYDPADGTFIWHVGFDIENPLMFSRLTRLKIGRGFRWGTADLRRRRSTPSRDQVRQDQYRRWSRAQGATPHRRVRNVRRPSRCGGLDSVRANGPRGESLWPR